MKRFFKTLFPQWFPPPVKRSRARRLSTPSNNTHNLQTIYQDLNARYFEGKLNIAIQWSAKRATQGKRSRRLGSYCLKRKRILIDGRLDQPHFPEEFIAFIVYHEMLHSALPPLFLKSGRRAIHHLAFRQKEKEFQGYEEIKRWEKEHFHLFFG